MIRFYDAIVIGLQPAGLIAAALLTRRGFNVAVVDHNELPGSYEQNGRRFPLAPSLTPNLHQSNIVRNIHRELGCSSLFQEQAKAHHFQAVLCKNRLDIRPTTAELIKELKQKIRWAEFKRRQAPPGIRISSKAFGAGRRYPIINSYGA